MSKLTRMSGKEAVSTLKKFEGSGVRLHSFTLPE